MRYVMAKIKEDDEAMAYRIYVTDHLRALSQGFGVQSERYYTVIHPKPVDNRTSEDIISHMKHKLKSIGEH